MSCYTKFLYLIIIPNVFKEKVIKLHLKSRKILKSLFFYFSQLLYFPQKIILESFWFPKSGKYYNWYLLFPYVWWIQKSVEIIRLNISLFWIFKNIFSIIINMFIWYKKFVFIKCSCCILAFIIFCRYLFIIKFD